MTERVEVERVVRELHQARLAGDLAGMCRLFAERGHYEIAGASADKPIAIRVEGIEAFRPWLAMMTKVFRLSGYELKSLIVEGSRAAAHWRVDILSKVTGTTVPTELVDLVEIEGGRIASYREFFVPR
jgi:ketosteroid isomerase-like protein